MAKLAYQRHPRNSRYSLLDTIEHCLCHIYPRWRKDPPHFQQTWTSSADSLSSGHDIESPQVMVNPAPLKTRGNRWHGICEGSYYEVILCCEGEGLTEECLYPRREYQQASQKPSYLFYCSMEVRPLSYRILEHLARRKWCA